MYSYKIKEHEKQKYCVLYKERKRKRKLKHCTLLSETTLFPEISIYKRISNNKSPQTTEAPKNDLYIRVPLDSFLCPFKTKQNDSLAIRYQPTNAAFQMTNTPCSSRYRFFEFPWSMWLKYCHSTSFAQLQKFLHTTLFKCGEAVTFSPLHLKLLTFPWNVLSWGEWSITRDFSIGHAYATTYILLQDILGHPPGHPSDVPQTSHRSHTIAPSKLSSFFHPSQIFAFHK